MLPKISRYLQRFSKVSFSPPEAIIAVTLNCNARCLMCDIWKESSRNEAKPEFYKRLPSSLREINITGGEPFLREDLLEIIRVIKESCPRARLLISTNGFLTEKIKKVVSLIIKIDPKIAIRVSIDGEEKLHDRLRGVKGAYKKAMATLRSLRKTVKDLGIGFTLLEENKDELLAVFNYCKREHLDFSLSLVSSSSIYFGRGKEKLRPYKKAKIKKIFDTLINSQYSSISPKDWFRAWFSQSLYEFLITKKRRFICEGGKDFFYLDPYGRVYICQLKPWLIGDLKQKTFKELFDSKTADKRRKSAENCNACWMVCNVRSTMKKNIASIGWEAFSNKLNFSKDV